MDYVIWFILLLALLLFAGKDYVLPWWRRRQQSSDSSASPSSSAETPSSPEPDSDPESESESESEPEQDSESEPENGPDPESASETEPVPAPEPEPELDSDSEPESKSESESEQDSGSSAATAKRPRRLTRQQVGAGLLIVVLVLSLGGNVVLYWMVEGLNDTVASMQEQLDELRDQNDRGGEVADGHGRPGGAVATQDEAEAQAASAEQVEACAAQKPVQFDVQPSGRWGEPVEAETHQAALAELEKTLCERPDILAALSTEFGLTDAGFAVDEQVALATSYIDNREKWRQAVDELMAHIHSQDVRLGVEEGRYKTFFMEATEGVPWLFQDVRTSGPRKVLRVGDTDLQLICRFQPREAAPAPAPQPAPEQSESDHVHQPSGGGQERVVEQPDDVSSPDDNQSSGDSPDRSSDDGRSSDGDADELVIRVCDIRLKEKRVVPQSAANQFDHFTLDFSKCEGDDSSDESSDSEDSEDSSESSDDSSDAQKDPSEGPMRNDDISESVKGPGTTAPGGDPGEADAPEDHDRSREDVADDGCEGDCPAPESSPQPDSERTPESGDQPPAADEPSGGNDPEGNDPGSCGDGARSCGYEQPGSSDGTPPEDDQSSGGGQSGVVEQPADDSSGESSADDSGNSSSGGDSDDSQSSESSDSDSSSDNEASSGSSEDSSEVGTDSKAEDDDTSQHVDNSF
ncbi:hypothetical protein BRC19_02620 [Candidatus Saccharibacteria bacterium QS_5_54_17]|nr:MAG: hypothetical protein BRC19_02620 [Candidatus Saccharibacteria bacterium QS_5_54_17]